MSQPADKPSDPALPWRHGAAIVIVHFRLTPKSSKDAIDGLCHTTDGPAFQARVSAPPANGAANAALIKLVSAWLDVPKSTIELVKGGKSRLKSIQISGSPGDLTQRLQDRLRAIQATTQAAQ